MNKHIKLRNVGIMWINLENIGNFKKFKISNLEKIKKQKFDIIILSVPHKKILNFLKKNIFKILKNKNILFDIKNKLNLREDQVDFKL